MSKPNATQIRLAKRLDEIVTETETLQSTIAEDGGDTPENQEKFTELLTEGEKILAQIENQKTFVGLKSAVEDPVEVKGGDGEYSQEFRGGITSIGDQFVNSDVYKSSIKNGKVASGTMLSVEVKGFMNPAGRKATVDTAATGLDSTVNYQGNNGVPVLVEQQRLTIRDLLAQAQTTMNAVPYIKETSYTNAADTVAEEGEKPEATFALEDASAPVKKIAVTAKVTDEMYADFPLMRDYLNNRLRFMVAEREEAQLLNGAGTGSQITGILQTSGIQTQAKSSDTVPDAIHKAMTKVRSVGFFEPDALVIHPNDWQELRLLKDDNNQYYGGGPFGPMYGQMLWGLKVVVTTAIAEGTALVGAFKLGAQVFQREGVTVESTNSHEDDFQYNRMTIRVEERLALAVYRALAFCKVTGI